MKRHIKCSSPKSGGSRKVMGAKGRASFVLSVSLLVSCLTSPCFARCPIELARYRMAHSKAFTAGFYGVKKSKEWISDVAFFLHSNRSGHSYWYMFDQGSARYISIVPVRDVAARDRAPSIDEIPPGPNEGMDFLAADDHYNFSSDAPLRRNRRPSFIVLPDLPEVLKGWENAPQDIFKYDHCAAPGVSDF